MREKLLPAFSWRAIKTHDGNRVRLLRRQSVPLAATRSAGLILGGVLLIAAITIGTTIMAGNFRERALRNSERELENTVLLLARHFDQQLEDFGAVQEDLVAHMQSGRHRLSEPITSVGCPARTFT